MPDPRSNGHRLVLFDIDGTLISAGRIARDAILKSLETAYPWRAGDEHQDRSRYDFSGKTVFPVVTYAVSGLGTVPDDYERLCDGARIGQGLAVRGERVRSAGAQVDSWLRRTRLRDERSSARRRP